MTPTPKIETGSFVRQSTSEVVVSYLVLGVTHILPSGLDHVLFVVALVLGTGLRPRRLLLLLSLFTLAHTVTLALGALDWVVVDASIIEPLIALSIAFVAIENLLFRTEQRYRPYVVVAFGLLHGQGFAGALNETGVPEGTFVPALLSFNVGVELGQLAVAAATAAVLWLFAKRLDAEQKAVRWGSAAIALVGLGWTASRLVS